MKLPHPLQSATRIQHVITHYYQSKIP